MSPNLSIGSFTLTNGRPLVSTALGSGGLSSLSERGISNTSTLRRFGLLPRICESWFLASSLRFRVDVSNSMICSIELYSLFASTTNKVTPSGRCLNSKLTVFGTGFSPLTSDDLHFLVSRLLGTVLSEQSYSVRTYILTTSKARLNAEAYVRSPACRTSKSSLWGFPLAMAANLASNLMSAVLQAERIAHVCCRVDSGTGGLQRPSLLSCTRFVMSRSDSISCTRLSMRVMAMTWVPVARIAVTLSVAVSITARTVRQPLATLFRSENEAMPVWSGTLSIVGPMQDNR